MPKSQLANYLVQARTANPKLRTVIKGDRDAEYGIAEDVMDILQKTQITRFSLVTDLAGPVQRIGGRHGWWRCSCPTRKEKGKKRKKGRRLGIRIDMTPLVDVAFLLLTFFMFTTSMSRPQTMEINLPPDKDVKVEIAESNLLTLRINEKGEIFWNVGIESPKKLDRADTAEVPQGEIAGKPQADRAGESRPRREVLR